MQNYWSSNNFCDFGDSECAFSLHRLSAETHSAVVFVSGLKHNGLYRGSGGPLRFQEKSSVGVRTRFQVFQGLIPTNGDFLQMLRLIFRTGEIDDLLVFWLDFGSSEFS